MLSLRLVFPATMLLAGCTLGSARSSGTGSGPAWITVRNVAVEPLSVTVCGPSACHAPRLLQSGDTSRFAVEAGKGTRAVVTGKRGDRVVAQEPVDFSPGHRIAVDISPR